MAENYSPPMGPRFSQLYVERGLPKAESKRLRNRVAAYFEQSLSGYTSAASDAIGSRIGPDHRFNGYTSSVTDFLRNCALPDFHDAITVIHGAIYQKYQSERYMSHERSAAAWLAFCRDAFIEENVAFVVDAKCVVHPFVDLEFSQNITSLLRGLSDSRLSAVRAEVERAVADLGGREPDPKSAIRSVFEAIEIYSKLAITTCKVARLNRNVVIEHMLPRAQSATGESGPPADASRHFAEAFCDWIAACHIYRHGQGVNEPSPPPPELAVALVSAGCTYLRWLLDILPL